MEPIIHPDPFDDSAYLIRLSGMGVRILAIIDGQKVSLLNKHLRDRTRQYFELQCLPNYMTANSAILDGELVALREGKPSFPTIMRRDRCSKPQEIERLHKAIPIEYMVFDLLYFNGQDLRNKPLAIRQAELLESFTAGPGFNLVENFPSGTELFGAVNSMGLEGIVAKKKDSQYIQGKKHRQWLKIKCYRSQNCLIGGYTLRGKRVNSLLLGVFREKEFLFAGKAASGLTSAQQDLLSQEFPRLTITHSPFSNLPSSVANLFLNQSRVKSILNGLDNLLSDFRYSSIVKLTPQIV